jgi:L-asparagine transporter-like permease
LTFSLFAHGFNQFNAVWLVLVLIGTGIACYRAQLPGSEHRPYILRFDEDKPNPLYRRVCYTFAWNAILNFALMNLIGLVIAVVNGRWYMAPIYQNVYLPVCALILILGFAGLLPRVMRSTKGEGTERRYFYGAVWSVTAAQTILLVLWKTLPQNSTTNWAKLTVYLGVLLFMGYLTYNGRLPRTRPIVAGELIVD